MAPRQAPRVMTLTLAIEGLRAAHWRFERAEAAAADALRALAAPGLPRGERLRLEHAAAGALGVALAQLAEVRRLSSDSAAVRREVESIRDGSIGAFGGGGDTAETNIGLGSDNATTDTSQHSPSISERTRRQLAAFKAYTQREDDGGDFEARLAACVPGPEALADMFTAEEALGACLDLVAHHRAWLGLMRAGGGDGEGTDYVSYVSCFDDVQRARDAAAAAGAGAQYAAYVRGLCGYLRSFVRRALPLVHADDVFCASGESAASTHTGEGSGGVQLDKVDETTVRNTLDIAAAVDSADGESHSAGSVPAITASSSDDPQSQSNIFCDSCERFFANRNVHSYHLRGKRHTAAAAKQSSRTPIAEDERTIVQIARMLGGVRQETRLSVERRLARTPAERAAESAADTKSDYPREEEPPLDTNPLNLPLDWDGRPIPFWLWRLQGLGLRFPCEICGGHAYMGRRAFDAHFAEWRHAAAMRALGIPNTRHFFHVTAIADARALWERLRGALRAADAPDVLEECEDRHGNVYSRRTYDDLVKQGLM